MLGLEGQLVVKNGQHVIYIFWNASTLEMIFRAPILLEVVETVHEISPAMNFVVFNSTMCKRVSGRHEIVTHLSGQVTF